MDNHVKVFEMMIITVGGWAISVQEIVPIARVISLLVPAVLSILIYVKKSKNGKK